MNRKPHDVRVHDVQVRDVQVHVAGDARDAAKAQEIIAGAGAGFIACEQRAETGGFRLAVRTATPDEEIIRSLRDEFRAPGYAVQKYPQPVPGPRGIKTGLIVVAPLI